MISAYQLHWERLDGGRRVVQCPCGRARLYRGAGEAERAGWTWKLGYRRGPVRVWRCPDHRSDA